MATRSVRIWFLFCALILLGPACAGGGKSGGPVEGKGKVPLTGAAAKPDRTPLVAGSPFIKADSKLAVPPPPSAARDPECVKADPKTQTSPLPQQDSWVVAEVDGSGYFGPNCPKLSAGTDCQVPFRGGWNLVDTPTGSMVFQVFENDAKDPVISRELGGFPPAGKFSSATRLFYKVSPTARKATFRVFLKDAAGRVVAQSDPETVGLPACFTSRQ